MRQHSQVVAVVDDDAAVRHALKFALEFEGLKVCLHESAQALLADANLPRYGCLVIDYRMPDVDGLELVEVLRGKGIGVPVIMITGRANAGLRTRAGRAGINTVLEKPLSDGSLAAAIHSALGLPPATA
jgi:two-component system, LuxR family, response regulator FixJ